MSRPYIAAIETGRANPSLDMVMKIAERLGLEIDLVARPPLTIAGPPAHDIVHARCSGYIDRRFRREGWDVRREVEVMLGRSHGWIDLLAFDPRTGTLLIVEIKTRVNDLGSIERQLGWYERQALEVARGLGWQVERVAGWLIGLASHEVDLAIQANADAFRVAFPSRAPEMALVFDGVASPVSRGIALIDPSSRRRQWLLRTRSDGRRSAAPYRDYADAATRFRS